MCSCAPQSVYVVLPEDWKTPWVEHLFGREAANYLRALVGADVSPDSPYGLNYSCTDSFLAASLSVWALQVILLSFAAGLLIRARRKAGGWMLAIGVAVSAADFGLGLRRLLDEAGSAKRALILDYWPAQLAFNFTFHIAVPFALGIGLPLLVVAVRLVFRSLLTRRSP